MKQEAKKIVKQYIDLWDELNKLADKYKAIYYPECYNYCYPKALALAQQYNRTKADVDNVIADYINTALGIQLDYLTNNEFDEDVNPEYIWNSIEYDLTDHFEMDE